MASGNQSRSVSFGGCRPAPNLRGTDTELSQIKIAPFPRRFDVKPTQDVPIGTKNPREAMLARWWLVPSWHKGDLKDWKATTFNTRFEDAATKPTLRAVWKHGRCLVLVGGYYEWAGDKDHKQPHLIRSAGNEETLWFAGLASRWQDLLTCTIMTRAANESVQAIHHKKPVTLNLEEREAWLGGTDDLEISASAQLVHQAVARFGSASATMCRT